MRLFIWILIIQFSLGHNLLAELARLPQLAEHFQAHREELPEMTLGQFLWLHYNDPQHEQSDSRHAGLPLHCTHAVLAESTLPQAPDIVFVAWEPSIPQHLELQVSDEFLRLSVPLSGVFRPPIA